MRAFRVAVAQIAPTLGDLEKNLALHEKTARDAIAQSANLLIFPELSLTAFTNGDAAARDAFSHDLMRGLQRFGFVILKDHNLGALAARARAGRHGLRGADFALAAV